MKSFVGQGIIQMPPFDTQVHDHKKKKKERKKERKKVGWMGGGLTLKPGREHMLYSVQLPLTKNNQGISHREDDTPTF